MAEDSKNKEVVTIMEDASDPIVHKSSHRLFILRGFPGCGKSSFVKKYGLEPYTLSLDKLRLMMHVPISGVICQDFNQEVGGVFDTFLRTRMSFGNFTVVDNTNLDLKSLEKCLKYANRWNNYEVTVFDFTKAIPMEKALELNEQRKHSFRYVPKFVFERMEERRVKDLDELYLKIDRVIDLGTAIHEDGTCGFYVHSGDYSMAQVEKFLEEVVPYPEDRKRDMEAYAKPVNTFGTISSMKDLADAFELRKHGLL